MAQFWPVFIDELRKPRKIANTHRILVKVALSDAELIVVFVKTKTSKNQHLLAEKSHFYGKYSKFSDFGQNAKRQFLSIFVAGV